MKRILSLTLALFMIFSLLGVLSSCSYLLPENIDTSTSEPQHELVLIEDTSDKTDNTTTAPDPVSEAEPEEPEQLPDVIEEPGQSPEETESVPVIDENGTYDDRDSVALYIHTYGKLPSNYITKKEAENLGWTGGSIENYAPGKCIGGSYFGNYEGLLPKKKGREYHECDIDTLGKSSRGAKRIIYSNDGLIYYTGDHYETFVLLYGEE